MAAKKKATSKPKITTPDNTAFGLVDIGFQNAAKNAASGKPAADVGKFTPVIPSKLASFTANLQSYWVSNLVVIFPIASCSKAFLKTKNAMRSRVKKTIIIFKAKIIFCFWVLIKGYRTLYNLSEQFTNYIFNFAHQSYYYFCIFQSNFIVIRNKNS